MTTTPPIPPSRGVDRSTAVLLIAAFVGNLCVWWLQQFVVSFDLLAPLSATVMLVCDAWIAWTYARREPIVGYVLGGAAVIVQIGFLILLAKAKQSGLQ